MKQKLLLISNSTNFGEAYLGWPQNFISQFMKPTGVKRILFIPYAGIGMSAVGLNESFSIYEQRVNAVFNALGYEIYSIHHEKDALAAVNQAEAIAVGGGNTFHLVYMMHKMGIMEAMRDKVKQGIPFMGWSAGANVACPSLKTTNDMPVIEPESFNCLNLVPFQINPHYLDSNPEGHGGETRQQRIEEFLIVNRETTVVGLREATLLWIENGSIKLKGSRPMRVFNFMQEPTEFLPGADINFLLK